ncbi:hypothetical protein [Lacrimispora sp. JR3]|uniref:hypothetical protein n=1 Tax=Lacrimispora sinapis TaxID=3111456 RepID=UPI0037490D1B
MKNQWNVTIQGKEHEISFKPGFLRGKRYVDGVGTTVKNTNWYIRLFDDVFEIDGETLHLTAVGAKIDLVVDGMYVNAKKPYTPFKTVPPWVNIVSALLLLSGMYLSGLFGLFIGTIAGIIMITQSVSPKRDNPAPVCIACAVCGVILQIALMILFLRL